MRRGIALFCSLALPLAAGCGAESPQGNQVELRLVDAPTDEVKEIVVTITKVTAHGSGGWETLAEETHTVDLLKLQGGTFAQLGVTDLPEGKINQFRLYVKEDGPNYVVTPDGKQHPLKVPSGTESGIKFKGGISWPKCASGNLTFDFDGKKSIHVHDTGKGDQWILRPVIKLKSAHIKEGECAEREKGKDGRDGKGEGKEGGRGGRPDMSGGAGGSATGAGGTAGSMTGAGGAAGAAGGMSGEMGGAGGTGGSSSPGTGGVSGSGGAAGGTIITTDPSDPCSTTSCEVGVCVNGACRVE